MNKLFLIVGLLACGFAHASGKITFQPKMNLETGLMSPAGGLAIYEKLGGPFYLNSWTGYGQNDHEFGPDTSWFGTKNMVELPMFNWHFIVGLGIQNNYNDISNKWDNSAVGSVALKLW